MIALIKSLIYYPFINILTFFVWLVPGHNAVWGIILLTLLVRIILMLPSKRAAQAQRRMSQLQPLMDELKIEYGDDRQGLAAAQMELYKKNNINPFGSCVPLLIQLPVLLILYRTIANGLAPHNIHIYSWLPQPSFINTYIFGIDLLKPDTHLIHLANLAVSLPGILPWLAALTQLWSMKATLGATVTSTPGVADDPQRQMQKQMMYLLPVITLIFARGLPAGVSVYWVTTTLFSIYQQLQVNKEKYNLTGVDKALKVADSKHPEHAHDHSEVIAEVQPVLPTKTIVKEEAPVKRIDPPKPDSSETKKGVTVTVRRRKK